MDDHTLDKLEFHRIRELLSAQALCGLGRALALRIKPSKRHSQVSLWLKQLVQFQSWVRRRGLPPFGGIRDVRPLVRQAVPPGKLDPAQFSELASTLTGIHTVSHYFMNRDETAGGPGLDDQEYDAISSIVERIGDFTAVAERIYRVIDSHGRVRDDATDRLQRLRSEIARVKEKTRKVFDRLTHQPSITKYLQYSHATFHNDRMVLPLKADQRGRVPGIVHRSSDSGQTLFVEPAEAVELNNRRIQLLQEEQDEINRILWELTHLVHLNQKEILQTLDAVALVDLLTAKVKFGDQFQMHVAKINERNHLQFNQARNPILMALAEDNCQPASYEGRSVPRDRDVGNGQNDRQVVPIHVRLGDDFDIMIITGPNTGGKTATLKTVGLLVLMTQSGLPIPADEGATQPLFGGVWIDVGDEQSLQQSLSTFSGHLARILDIIQRSRLKSTLVLLDEVGAGTDPEEGAALGKAIIDHLLSVGCLAMITTHLGDLKAMGYQRRRVDNAAVQFDANSLQPTYQLRIGEPGNSNAIAIASHLGMPKKMINAARRHLSSRHRSLEKAISGSLSARRDAERARQDAECARQMAARETLAALDKQKTLEEKIRAYDDWVKRMIKLQPGDKVCVRHFDGDGRITRIHLDKLRAVVSIGTMELEVPLSDLRFDCQ